MSDSNIITFDAHGLPKAQARPRAFKDRAGNVRVYDPATAEGWKAQIALAAKEFIPFPAWDCPVVLDIIFRFQRPKHHFRSNGQLKADAPHWRTGRNDLDNLCKAVMDALTTIGLWKDDGQVVELGAVRIYNHQCPGATITVRKA